MDQNTVLRAVVAFNMIRRRRKKRIRNFYMRSIFRNRDISGEMCLVEELQQDPYYHHRYFRMNSSTFEKLLGHVRMSITHSNTHLRPISPTERLAITLRYLACGSSQISLAMSYRISPASVSLILRETMSALITALSPTYLEKPSEDVWKQNELDFKRNWNFPNCIGAIDGKHIRVKCPARSSSQFYNYKSFYSVVLLAVVNAKYEFALVDIGSSGSQSDSGILMRSAIGRGLEEGSLNVPPPKEVSESSEINEARALPHVILGDEGFQLKPYMMRPYPGRYLQQKQKEFNYRLSRGRMVVENAFGILAARWRIFHSVIDADVELVKLITHTCVILHNLSMQNNDLLNFTLDRFENGVRIDGSWREEVGSVAGMTEIHRQGSNNAQASATEVRDAFADFMFDEGALPWQRDYVNRIV